jgi:hypothetical protein
MSETIHKSNSFPDKLDKITTNNSVKNSFSESQLNELLQEVYIPENQIEIIFEGDGPLGILFAEQDNGAIVSGINSGTVAAVEIDLTIGLKIIKIEEYTCDYISYKDIMDLVLLRWNKYSKLKLRFEKIVEPLNLTTNCPVYQLLETVNCEDYYDCFLEIGVKTLEDMNYIEYQDLINMKMPSIQRRIFNKVINLDHKETTHLPKPPSMVFQEPCGPHDEYDYGDLITDDV